MNSGPIQVIPAGLLGFLQLKVGGENPRELSDLVQGTYDLRDQYFQARAVDYQQDMGGLVSQRAISTATGAGPFTFNPVGGVQPLLVPLNEIWYVPHYTVTCRLDVAADSTAFYAAMFTNAFAGVLNTYMLTDISETQNGDAAELTWCCSTAKAPFWAPPGAALGFFAKRNISATGNEYEGFARIVRLKL